MAYFYFIFICVLYLIFRKLLISKDLKDLNKFYLEVNLNVVMAYIQNSKETFEYSKSEYLKSFQ